MIGLAVYFLNLLIPDLGKNNSPDFMMIIDIFVRSSIIVLIFGLLIIKTRVSPDLNDNYRMLISKIKSIFKKA
jgi:hypothetical protein